MRIAVLAVIALTAFARPAAAQLPKPLPRFVADVRGFWSGLGQDPLTASDLEVEATALPKRAPGGVAGVHVYILRKTNLAVGVGAEGVVAEGRAQEKDKTTGEVIGPRITQRLQGFSGSVSLNFGHRDGWSYVSAGMGPLSFATYTGDKPAERPPVKSTINLGAGARWFASRHFAFCFDLRFYQTRPELATESYGGRERSRIRILSAGISIR